MRSVISISLPLTITKSIEQDMKEEHFASKSEFFRHLYRDWRATKLARELADEDRKLKPGDVKVMKKVSDLWS